MHVAPRMAVFTIVGTLAYLWLAALGEGGLGPFFSHPPLVALAVVTLGLAVSALFTRGNLSPGEREDRSNRWVLGAFALIGLMLGYAPALSDRLDLFVVGGDGTRWVGVLLSAVGGALRIAPVFALGERFSGLVAIQPGHELVTDGLYRRIRNPSYLGLLIGTLGWSLAFRSIVGVLLTALLVVPLVARMKAEEALLGERFGEAYAAYRARTWRLVPWVY
ncbi:MAG: isoprenylcysteine carboxylmethyltransferase family protein [Roseiarcus sp.]|jgi:protein-S-isoprenylcysteine O-methyltransferase Ste14